MVSKTEKLRQLTNAEASPEHQADFNKQLFPEGDDRGACLLIVAQIDTMRAQAPLPTTHGNLSIGYRIR